MEIVGPEVDLVVKAANQQTPDVKIQGLSAWSVRDLKLHLAENYPNKPNVEEQKIIYSGRLLPDSAVLKDVLRHYEGQQAHTLHLVCARQRPNNTDTTEPNTSSAGAADSDGMRRRNVGESSIPASPDTWRNDQNPDNEMRNYYAYVMTQYTRNQVAPGPMFHSTNPASHYHQMLMMQQAYTQYMQQYAHMWQATAGNLNVTQPVNVANEQEPQRAAAGGEGNEEEGEGAAPRDWLDWVYALCRLAILFSLLYLYSTPLRLGLVMILAAAYFFQMAAFREVQPQNRNNADQRQRADPPRPEENAATAENQSQPQNAEAQQSVLGATWMIVTSFFTSLIPDAPNVV